MTESSVVVRRSGWKAWALAMLSIPLLVIAADVLTRRRLTDFFRELLFRPDDTQLFEPRDVIWASLLGLIGLAFALWGLRELLFPTPVFVASPEGIRVRLGSPFSRTFSHLAWEQVDDLGASTIDDDGDSIPVLWIRVFDRRDLPENPWGARWIDERTLAVTASDWDRRPSEVAAASVDVAVSSASQGLHES